jgi:DNA-directed RNA polymerase specialized sigma24 family protein
VARPRVNSAVVAGAGAYRRLLDGARRFTRAQDAGDLAHDVLLASLERGIGDWAEPERKAWWFGAFRRHSAFVARGAARRRAREQRLLGPEQAPPEVWRLSPAWISALPPATRRLAALLAADLERDELAYLLGTSPEALRQRFTQLRRLIGAAGVEVVRASERPRPNFALGVLRAPLILATRRAPPRSIGTHDPDGHLLLFSEVEPSRLGGRRQRTG